MAWLIRLQFVEGSDDATTERVSSLLWELGTTGVAQLHDHSLLAGFDTAPEASAAASAVTGAAGVATAVAERVDDDAWIDPDRVGAVVVAGETVPLAVGPAFGHGRHPTTVLALELMAQVGVGGADVLDLGTGTGVLAVAAAGGGARSVRAVDNDPAALAVARRNVRAVAGRVGDDGRPWAPIVVAASAGDDRFDVVVANVLLTVHADIGRGLTARLRAGGHLVATGVLATQRTQVERAYPTLAVTATATRGDWLGLVLRHRAVTGGEP
ncbi:MAG: 50S ribosomal protein L11 methyltransferase [Acidimicrobiales bacterium]